MQIKLPTEVQILSQYQCGADRDQLYIYLSQFSGLHIQIFTNENKKNFKWERANMKEPQLYRWTYFLIHCLVAFTLFCHSQISGLPEIFNSRGVYKPQCWFTCRLLLPTFSHLINSPRTVYTAARSCMFVFCGDTHKHTRKYFNYFISSSQTQNNELYYWKHCKELTC